MFRRILIVVVVAFLPGCALTTSYVVKSDVNAAVYYRARYVDACVTQRVSGVPCEAWASAQRKLDTAAGEAVDAMRIGGSAQLQVAALRRRLASVQKEFGPWLK